MGLRERREVRYGYRTHEDELSPNPDPNPDWRLGHGTEDDEWTPKRVEAFDGLGDGDDIQYREVHIGWLQSPSPNPKPKPILR